MVTAAQNGAHRQSIVTRVAPFPVLFLCVGNVCRSPFAERLLRLRLDQQGSSEPFEVSSAGVLAMAGREMHPVMAGELASRGGSGEGFVARQLSEGLVEHAVLVLAATKEIRSRVLQEAPTALRRTFTMLEFAALARAAPLGLGVEDLVRSCAERRSAAVLPGYDIGDPMGAPGEVFASVAADLDTAVTSIAHSLNPSLLPEMESP